MTDPFHIYPERVLKRARRARGGAMTTVRLDLRLDAGLLDATDRAAALAGETDRRLFRASRPAPRRADRRRAVIVPTVAVSKHAINRYLERVRGVDPAGASAEQREAARAEIVAITGVAAALGASCKAHDGHVFIIDGYTVTTVLPKGGVPARRSLPTRGRYAVASHGGAA